MTEALEISKFSKSFHDEEPSKTIKSFKRSTSDSFKLKEKFFKVRREITSESTTLGAEHVFSIPYSYTYVSDFSLEFIGTNVSAYDIGRGGVCNLIKSVTFDFDRGTFTYSGKTLLKMLCLINRDQPLLGELIDLMGEGDTNADPMITMLIGPGSHGRIATTPYDISSPSFPIGMMNKDLVIRVVLQTGAYFSKTNAFIASSIKLRFDSYAIAKENIQNVRASRSGLYYSQYFMRPIDNEYTQTLTDATESEFQINNTITQGILNAVVISVLDRTTSATDMEYFDYQPIDNLVLKVRGGSKLYEHTSQQEGRLRCLKDWKILNKINSTTASLGYFYPMSLTACPSLSITNLGSEGINLNDNKPTIAFTCTTLQNSASAHTVEILALYKCKFNVNRDKTISNIIIPV